MKYALASIVKDGLLCKDGQEIEVSPNYSEGERWEGLVITFDTLELANEYIKEHGYWALEAIEFNYE
jgi:hypothetical protein